MTVTNAFKQSWMAILQPPIFFRVLIPFFISLLLAIAFAVTSWILITNPDNIDAFKKTEFLSWFIRLYETTFGAVLINIIFYIFLLGLFSLTLYLATILLTSFLVIPLLGSTVHRMYFPNLQKHNELTFLGSIGNTIKSLLVFFVIMLFCVPLLFVPILQFFVPFILNTYLARKLFMYDVLQGFATKSEFIQINSQQSSSVWKLSTLSGLYLYMPVVNLLAPAFMALAFIFYGFGQLQKMRQELSNG